jgi:hypothetical protein
LDHAHIHVLPGSYELAARLPEPLVSAEDRRTAIETFGETGYIYLDEPSTPAGYTPDPGVSQFLRRKVSEKLDITEEWDYLVYPRLENVADTIARLRGRLR